MLKQTTSAVNAYKFLAICLLLTLQTTPNCGQPIQSEAVEASNIDDGALDSLTEVSAEAPAEVAAEPSEEPTPEVNPLWLGGDEWVADKEEHDRPARHIGFGGFGGGLVGGFAGGAVASPVYTVPVVQTVPVIATVPVVSTISTYPTYATGYGYGGYAPIGFGGLGFGKFRSSYSVKGFGLGGGFLG